MPWLQTVPIATTAGVQPDPLNLRAAASSPKAKIGCLIVVDSVPVAAQRPEPGFAECKGQIPDTGSSAQPASARSRLLTG